MSRFVLATTLCLGITALIVATSTSTPTPTPKNPHHSPQSQQITPGPPTRCHSNLGNPDPQCTPGVVGSALNVCHEPTSDVRPSTSYTNALKRNQLHVYDYTDKNSRDYEEDHLVPLALGGNPTDPHNLWPEPRHPQTSSSASALSSAEKDDLETYLFRQVCKYHAMTLQRAQQVFLSADLLKQYLTLRPPHAPHTSFQQGQ